MHMHAVLFIQDLAIIMLIAGIITVLCHRFNQPVVLGYILAGVIIGPYTPPFMWIHDEKTINTLAELGVIFLMFSLGLEFDLHNLRRVGLTALVASLIEIILMLFIGYGLGRLFNWSPINSLFLGAILSISSTTIIVKALEDLHIKKERFAQLIFGILIIEDIFAIAILALLSTIAISGKVDFNDVFLALTKLASFLAISLIIGILFVPKILAYVARFKNKEMLLITALGLCFGFCLLVLRLNYSVALGAFIIGAIIAESRQLQLIERLVVPLRDMFSAIFFVSVGLLFDFRIVFDYAMPIVIVTVAVVIGKIISSILGMLLTGQDGKTAVRVGLGLAQIGEFSFIIASLGVTLHVTGKFLYFIAVAVSALTTLLTPLLIKYSEPFANYLEQKMPKAVLQFYEKYQAWLRYFKPPEYKEQLFTSIRHNCLWVTINLLVVLAIFMAENYISLTTMGEELKLIMGEYWQPILFWDLALLVSLPFLVAIYRGLRTLSLLLIDFIYSLYQKKYLFSIRRSVSIILPVIMLVMLLFLLLSISANNWPPKKQLIYGMIIPACIVISILPWLVNIQAKMQSRFTKALKKKKD